MPPKSKSKGVKKPCVPPKSTPVWVSQLLAYIGKTAGNAEWATRGDKLIVAHYEPFRTMQAGKADAAAEGKPKKKPNFENIGRAMGKRMARALEDCADEGEEVPQLKKRASEWFQQIRTELKDGIEDESVCTQVLAASK